MKKYKVMIDAGANGVDFFDMYAMVGGQKTPIKCKKDEFIPEDKISPDIFNSSLIHGCLSRAIKSKWVEVIDSAELPVSETKYIVIGEGLVVADTRATTNIITATLNIVPDKVEEIVKSVEDNLTKNDIKTLIDFNKLKTNEKYIFVESCENIALLKEIENKIINKSLQNKVNKRITLLEKS